MSYVIYEKSSTLIIGKPDRNGVARPDHRKEYKTLAAAQAALTRAENIWWQKIGKFGTEPKENDPRFRCAIAAKAYFHQNIEKSVKKQSLMDPTKEFMEPVNTPNYMSPASETYWSM